MTHDTISREILRKRIDELQEKYNLSCERYDVFFTAEDYREWTAIVNYLRTANDWMLPQYTGNSPRLREHPT